MTLNEDVRHMLEGCSAIIGRPTPQHFTILNYARRPSGIFDDPSPIIGELRRTLTDTDMIVVAGIPGRRGYNLVCRLNQDLCYDGEAVFVTGPRNIHYIVIYRLSPRIVETHA